ncbi:ABC transporter permease [Bosea sp. (in: a-proteobacteria)]|uniref:ABC transporter permease n=1 Tax=Bosea sp. (in: a-proteobacteria) TaxID=1871050 RepID=UPI0026357675|nr:ABC transporter permease [Bosea sp. (in: a-proteobacteria)]MCO5089578.1 ABC transporter permease [Bosea sp. (in: a-proteobacteria)]
MTRDSVSSALPARVGAAPAGMARSRPPRAGLPWLAGFTVMVCVFLVTPIAVVLLSSLTAAEYVTFPPQGLSLRWYVAVLQNEEFLGSLMVSLRVAAISSLIACVVGVSAAIGLVRLRFPGRGLVEGLFLSPLMIPGIVLGVAILQFYARSGLISSTASLIAGHLAITIPYVTRLAIGSLVGFDERLELAAQNLGASPLQAFRRITLPILFPAIAGAFAFAFIVSFEDVNLSLFLSSPQATTFPVRIYTYMSQESSPIISAASSLLVLIVLVVAIVIDRLVGLASHGQKPPRLPADAAAPGGGKP